MHGERKRIGGIFSRDVRRYGRTEKVAVLEDPTLLKYSKKKNNGETTTTKAGFDSKTALQRALKLH